MCLLCLICSIILLLSASNLLLGFHWFPSFRIVPTLLAFSWALDSQNLTPVPTGRTGLPRHEVYIGISTYWFLWLFEVGKRSRMEKVERQHLLAHHIQWHSHSHFSDLGSAGLLLEAVLLGSACKGRKSSKKLETSELSELNLCLSQTHHCCNCWSENKKQRITFRQKGSFNCDADPAAVSGLGSQTSKRFIQIDFPTSYPVKLETDLHLIFATLHLQSI